MRLFSDAKGNVSEVIGWLAIITTVLIVVVWYANHLNVEKLALEKAENDLGNVRKMVDDACELYYYKASYNPATETGTLDVNKTTICIETQKIRRCKQPLCALEAYDSNHSIDLSRITNIVVEKKSGVIKINGQ